MGKLRNIYLDEKIDEFNFEIGSEVFTYKLSIDKYDIVKYSFFLDYNATSYFNLKLNKIALFSIKKIIEYIGLAYHIPILNHQQTKLYNIILKFNNHKDIYGYFRQNGIGKNYNFEIWDRSICLNTIVLK